MTATTSSSPIKTILPGDDVTPHIPLTKNTKIGTGLHLIPSSSTTPTTPSHRIIATRAGQLHSHYHSHYLRSNTRRYTPHLNDNIIGIVEDRFGEYYRVNIFSPHPALLHQLSFEGATKRNRPMLTPGTLIYARVSMVDRDVDPEISCKVEGHSSNSSGASRKDWMTEEGTYGELKGGGVNFRVSLGLARELLKPDNVVLNALGERGLAFEVAIGVNGVVWCRAKTNEEVILIGNAVRNSEVMTDEQVRKMVKELTERMGRC